MPSSRTEKRNRESGTSGIHLSGSFVLRHCRAGILLPLPPFSFLFLYLFHVLFFALRRGDTFSLPHLRPSQSPSGAERISFLSHKRFDADHCCHPPFYVPRLIRTSFVDQPVAFPAFPSKYGVPANDVGRLVNSPG